MKPVLSREQMRAFEARRCRGDDRQRPHFTRRRISANAGAEPGVAVRRCFCCPEGFTRVHRSRLPAPSHFSATKFGAMTNVNGRCDSGALRRNRCQQRLALRHDFAEAEFLPDARGIEPRQARRISQRGNVRACWLGAQPVKLLAATQNSLPSGSCITVQWCHP